MVLLVRANYYPPFLVPFLFSIRSFLVLALFNTRPHWYRPFFSIRSLVLALFGYTLLPYPPFLEPPLFSTKFFLDTEFADVVSNRIGTVQDLVLKRDNIWKVWNQKGPTPKRTNYQTGPVPKRALCRNEMVLNGCEQKCPAPKIWIRKTLQHLDHKEL